VANAIGFNITPRGAFLYAAGLCFLALAKAKNVLRGYTTPRTFPISQTQRAVAYDMKVVDEWLAHFERLSGGQHAVRNQHVLELGPGSDLGVGLYLLAKGAASYCACDVHDLIANTPDSFYAALLERIRAGDPAVNVQQLADELRAARAGAASRLRLVVREDFDLVAAFGPASIDRVFSQAAFEHFDDVAATVAQLSAVCRSGATIVAVIDLKTHSRWIRNVDPNNIYRYSDAVYRRFWFRGAPNRVRPYRYRELFTQNGWADVSVTPLGQIRDQKHEEPPMDRQFRDARNQLNYLSVLLYARKL